MLFQGRAGQFRYVAYPHGAVVDDAGNRHGNSPYGGERAEQIGEKAVKPFQAERFGRGGAFVHNQASAVPDRMPDDGSAAGVQGQDRGDQRVIGIVGVDAGGPAAFGAAFVQFEDFAGGDEFGDDVGAGCGTESCAAGQFGYAGFAPRPQRLADDLAVDPPDHGRIAAFHASPVDPRLSSGLSSRLESCVIKARRPAGRADRQAHFRRKCAEREKQRRVRAILND